MERRSLAAVYEGRFNKVKQGIEFIFCGFEDNIPKVYAVYVGLSSKINENVIFGTPQYLDLDMKIPQGQMAYAIIGERLAMFPLEKTNIIIKEDNIPTGLNALIRLQHNLTPRDVGEICDIFMVNYRGITQLQDATNSRQ